MDPLNCALTGVNSAAAAGPGSGNYLKAVNTAMSILTNIDVITS